MLRRRLILLVPLLVLFAFLGTTVERAEGADVVTRAEGEDFTSQPAGSNVISGAGYSGGAALKFTQNNTASLNNITCSATCDVVLMASGGQSGGQATFSVNGSLPKALISTSTTAYTFHLPAGATTISVKAGNTGTGRNAVLDVVTFPASGGGGTDTTPPNVTIGSGPGDTSEGFASFTFSADEPATFECKLLRGSTTISPWAACTSPKTYSGLADGDYRFRVRGKDPSSNVSAIRNRDFTVTNGGGGTDPPPTWDCKGIHITEPADIDRIINSDGSGATRFCVHAGTYQVSEPAILKAGDKLDAQPGSMTKVDTAIDPDPVVKLVGSGTDNLLRANGSGISITWVDLSRASGTGTGTGAIAAGSAGSDFVVQYAEIHDNASLGISNMNGSVLDSEFYRNSGADSSLGFNASAVKGITEFEAIRVYVHDEQGNGLWCDVGCSNDSARANGFLVRDSVVVNNERAGIRYENSPNQALFLNNEIHGNGIKERRGGIDIRDSKNAQVLNNNFGPATIAGVSYLANTDRIGVRATDSGRSDRVDLSGIRVEGNNMNGDKIVTCDGRDVVCSATNTNVGR